MKWLAVTWLCCLLMNVGYEDVIQIDKVCTSIDFLGAGGIKKRRFQVSNFDIHKCVIYMKIRYL